MKGTQILMHKNDKVATCVFDSKGYLKSITKIHDSKLMPLCVKEENPVLDLQRWILERNISTNRRDIAPLRQFYGSGAFTPSTAISLFDCYWFSCENHMDWERENAYDNWNCKKDTLFLMMSHPDELKEIDTRSPNLTIPGRTPRIWYRSGEDTYLLYGEAKKEISNYKLANGLPILAERAYVILTGNIYATTKSCTNKKIERISFEDMYNSCQNPSKSKMQNLQYCCEKYNIPNWKDFFRDMFHYDELIGNKNRELSDIGVLRDTITLETIGFAKL